MRHIEIIELYCIVDEFYQQFERELMSSSLEGGRRHRQPRLSKSEVMTLLIWFHIQRGHDFRHFYCTHVLGRMRGDFPQLVSYNRFIELVPRVMIYLIAFQMTLSVGVATGVSFVDSTTLSVCRNQRIRAHKVFKGVAARGKTSMGWFYGFKLHLVISEQGHILGWILTPGNTADNDVDVVTRLCRGLLGKLFGDKGYISKELTKALATQGLELITKVRRNMKNKLLRLSDAYMLRKRAIIETINDQLKNIYQVEHSRHRNIINFIVNIASALAAYSLQPVKPAVKFYQRQIAA
jgi:hypothetical protein